MIGEHLLAEATAAAAFEGREFREFAQLELEADAKRVLERRSKDRPAAAARIGSVLSAPLAEQYALEPAPRDPDGTLGTGTVRLALPYRTEAMIDEIRAAADHAGLAEPDYVRATLIKAIKRVARRRAAGGSPRPPSEALLARQEGRSAYLSERKPHHEAERRLALVLTTHFDAEIERAARFDGLPPTPWMRAALDDAICAALGDRDAGGEAVPGTFDAPGTRELLEFHAVRPVPLDRHGQPKNARRIRSNMAAPDAWLQLLDEAAYHRGFLVRMNFIRQVLAERVRSTERRRRRGAEARPFRKPPPRQAVRHELEALKRFVPRQTVSELTFGAARRPVATRDA